MSHWYQAQSRSWRLLCPFLVRRGSTNEPRRDLSINSRNDSIKDWQASISVLRGSNASLKRSSSQCCRPDHNPKSNPASIQMKTHTTRLLTYFLAVAVILSAACSEAKAPGGWVTLDTGTGDSFFNANFVNENIGWLNGTSGRGPEEPDENANGNKKPKPRKPGEKINDPLKANQGFEVLQTTDGGQTWRPIPDQFKNKIRSVWFVDPQQGWALT